MHDAALTLAAQVGGVLVAFAASVVVARRLGPEGAGIVQLAQTLGNQVALVLSLGAAVSVVRFTALAPDDGRPFAAALALAALLLPVIAVLTALAPLLARPLLDGSGRQGLAITLAVPLGWLFVVQDLTVAVFRGRNRYRPVAALTLGTRVAVSAALVLTLVSIKTTPTAAVVAVVIANAAAALVTAAAGWLHVRPRFQDVGLRRLVAFNLRGHVGTVLQEASYRLDLFLVAGLRSTAEAGVYGIAGLLATLLWYVPNAIGSVLMSRLPSAANARRLVDAAGATLALMLALSAAAAVAAPFAIPAVFGQRFDGAVVPFLIVLPGAVLLSVWKVVANGLAGLGHPAAKVPSAALGAVLGLALDLWLIPAHGIRGAAAAAAIAYAATTLALLPAAGRIVGAPVVDFLKPDFAGAYRLLRSLRS